MKQCLTRLRQYMERSLRRQLVCYLVVGILMPLTLVTIALFLTARAEMTNQAVTNMNQRSQAIAAQVDEMVYNIRSTSDSLSYDEEIAAVLEKDYRDRPMEKLRDIRGLNSYFDNIDPMRKSVRLSGMYTKNKEVVNFMNPLWGTKSIEEKMLKLGATNREQLSMFHWYSLRENFFDDTKSGEIRRDQVVVGVRRILHNFTGNWMYTQFFVIPELQISSLYQESAAEMKGSIYIVDQEGNLISSSDENTVRTGAVPGDLILLAENAKKKSSKVTYRDELFLMDMETIKNADWRVITLVPITAATATIDRLFKEILLVMGLSIFLCGILITWISNRFLQPVEVLDASMKEVYDGNLEAYVKPDGYNGEIKSMITYYNAMLVQINRFIEEKVESEKKKKELELEVLMGQINPHFLYNTLENIVWKSNEVGRPDIGRIAASLGRLYRLSIGNGETLVSIQQEVEHVMAYVNIQKNRYKERMEFDLRVDYEKLWGYSMIKLTLQPVVENCFMYAMEDIDHVLKIRLTIRAKKDVITIFVTDNGSGMDGNRLEEVRKQIRLGKIKPAQEGKPKRKGTGIGLYSVKERIAIYTGYKDSLTIKSKPGLGTMVKITIPKWSSNDKNDR